MSPIKVKARTFQIQKVLAATTLYRKRFYRQAQKVLPQFHRQKSLCFSRICRNKWMSLTFQKQLPSQWPFQPLYILWVIHSQKISTKLETLYRQLQIPKNVVQKVQFLTYQKKIPTAFLKMRQQSRGTYQIYRKKIPTSRMIYFLGAVCQSPEVTQLFRQIKTSSNFPTQKVFQTFQTSTAKSPTFRVQLLVPQEGRLSVFFSIQVSMLKHRKWKELDSISILREWKHRQGVSLDNISETFL